VCGLEPRGAAARGRSANMKIEGNGFDGRALMRKGWVGAWPVLEQFAGPIAQFLLTPLLLLRMDPHQFALWILAQSLVVAAPTLSFGQSAALLAVLPRYSGEQRDAAAVAFLRATLRLIAVNAALAAVLVIGLRAALSALSVSLEPTLLYLLSVLALLVVTDLESMLSSVLKSYGFFHQSAWVEVGGRVAQVALTIAIIESGSSGTTAVLLVVATGVIKVMIKFGLVASRLRTAHPRTADLDNHQRVLQMRVLGIWNWINVLSGVLFYTFDRWAVGYFLGSTALAAYAVCNQLAQLTHSVPAAASQTLIPWAAARVHSTGREAALPLIRRVAWVSSLAAIVPALALIALAPYVLSLWISPQFSQEHSGLLRHLGIVFLLLSLNVPSFNLMLGIGKPRVAALVGLFAGIIYSTATLLLRPSSLATMVNLKLLYGVLALACIPLLTQVLKGLASDELIPPVREIR